MFSEELKKTSNISGIARIGEMPPSNFPQAMSRVKCITDNNEEKEILTALLFADQNTLETLGVNYVQGEGFINYKHYNY